MLLCKKRALDRSMESGLWWKKRQRRSWNPFATFKSITFPGEALSGIELGKIMSYRSIRQTSPIKKNYFDD